MLHSKLIIIVNCVSNEDLKFKREAGGWGGWEKKNYTTKKGEMCPCRLFLL